MTNGSRDNREMMDTRSRVSVKRLFRKALFRCCEVPQLKLSPDTYATSANNE